MLSKRERTIGWIAASSLGVFALNTLIIQPLFDRKDAADASVQAAQDDLANAQHVFQNDIRARRVWKEMAGESLLSDAPEAESQILNAVRGWAQASGLALSSVKPERSDKQQDFERIIVRATATGSMRQITQFLLAVQTASIPIRVSDVQLSSRREGADDLSLQVGLATIYLPPAPPPSPTVAEMQQGSFAEAGR